MPSEIARRLTWRIWLFPAISDPDLGLLNNCLFPSTFFRISHEFVIKISHFSLFSEAQQKLGYWVSIIDPKRNFSILTKQTPRRCPDRLLCLIRNRHGVKVTCFEKCSNQKIGMNNFPANLPSFRNFPEKAKRESPCSYEARNEALRRVWSFFRDKMGLLRHRPMKRGTFP